jgi:diguanylate cyclase (GGDEF)-like protein
MAVDISPGEIGGIASGSSEHRRSLRLLVAEDSEDDTLLLVRALRRAGFEPMYRRVDYPLALRNALDEAEWDLIITDYNMPQFSPDDVLRAVHERGLDMPIILVSAHLADARAADAMKAGINDYVLKDNLSRLGPAVERELREADNRHDHRRVAAELKRVASRDSLTGLANRPQLETDLARACKSICDVGHSFLYLDVDQFRVINENCGHHAGDELIRHLASVIAGPVRSGHTLARMGPDEFGVLMERCPVSRAWRIAEQMRRAVNAYRFSWEGHSYRIGISIGVVGISEAGLDVPEVLRRADLACHAAKDRGRNGIRLYTEEDVDVARRRGAMQWVARLQQALQNDELVLFEQSIDRVTARGSYPHSELLVRLEEADGRLIEPGLFIPAAEQFELMPLVDRWVIDHAFRAIGQDPRTEGRWFINLSGTSLSDETLPDYVGERLIDSGVEGARICFEITETAAIANMSAALSFMSHVRELGCAVALDDFGSGLSSFSYLKSLPADYLKIDGTFVRAMIDDALDRTIVEAITKIGHAAGKEVVAESVESGDVLDALAELGVDFVQGFLIGNPRRLTVSS